MRKLRSPEEKDYCTVVLNYLNLVQRCFLAPSSDSPLSLRQVFGNDERSRINWTIELKDSVQKRFRQALSTDEQSVLFDMRSAVYVRSLVRRDFDVTLIRDIDLPAIPARARDVWHQVPQGDPRADFRYVMRRPSRPTLTAITFDS